MKWYVWVIAAALALYFLFAVTAGVFIAVRRLIESVRLSRHKQPLCTEEHIILAGEWFDIYTNAIASLEAEWEERQRGDKNDKEGQPA